MGVVVRRAVDADVPQVVEFTRNTYAWGDYVPRVIEEWVRAGTAYVAVDGQQVLGVINYKALPTGVIWLEGIRVRPEARRRGVGTILTEHLIELARSEGFRYAMLMVAEWNEPSHGLVRKLGFSPVMEVYSGTVGLTGAREVMDAKERRTLIEEALRRSGGYFCFGWVCTRATPDYVAGIVKEVAVGPGIGLDNFSVGRPTSTKEQEVLSTEPGDFKRSHGKFVVYELKL